MKNRQFEFEFWTPIQGYEYEMSDHGRVRNIRTGKVLKLFKNKKGYLRVGLYKDGKVKKFRVHRLVYETFVGEIPDGMVIDHVDGDKTNNNLENLRVCTQKENCNNPVTRPKHVEAMRNKSSEWRKNNAEAVRKAMRNKSPEWKKKTADAVRKARSKSVVQIDKQTGETIKRWECIMDVERVLGINQSNISSCCNGRYKSAGGFKWQYAS